MSKQLFFKKPETDFPPFTTESDLGEQVPFLPCTFSQEILLF